MITGYVHSVQSLGTVDGPGVRSVVFLSGCPLRCAYCHNPDTWQAHTGEQVSAEALCGRVLKFLPYIRHGGVTFSGGEPTLQADFVRACTDILHAHGLHVAIDTCGELQNDAVSALLDAVDLVLLDVKATEETAYRDLTGGHLANTLQTLDACNRKKKDVWIRQVIVPNLNDTDEDADRLCALLSPYSCIRRVELLPFRKLCLEKYASLGLSFPLSDTPEADPKRVKLLQERIQTALSLI